MMDDAIPALSTLAQGYTIYHEEAAKDAPRHSLSMYEELHGTNDSRLYKFDIGHCAVSTESGRLYESIKRKVPGVTPYTPCVLLFPDPLVPLVARAIRAKKRGAPVRPLRQCACGCRKVVTGRQGARFASQACQKRCYRAHQTARKAAA